MFGCNQQITIWNRWNNQKTKKDEWFRCIVPVSVRWKYHTQRGVSGTSASVVNTIIVIMPPCDGYLPLKEWTALTDKSGVFTLQKGDLIALGAHDIEITGISPYRESDIRTLLDPNIMTIKGIKDNTLMAHAKHYKLEGI